MIPCIHLYICNAKRFKRPKSLKDENNSTSLLKQHANIISLNKASLHGLSLHCYKRCHLVETLRSHMHRPAFSRRYPIRTSLQWFTNENTSLDRTDCGYGDGGMVMTVGFKMTRYNDAFLWKRNWPSRKYMKLQSRWRSLSKTWQSFRNQRG